MLTITQFYRMVEKKLNLSNFPKKEVIKSGLAMIDKFWYYAVISDPFRARRYSFIPYLNGELTKLPMAIIRAKQEYTTKQVETLFCIGDKWNKEKFQTARQSIPIDKVQDTYAFLSPMPNVVNLPIKLSGNDEIFLPIEFKGMSEAISKIIDYEKQINPKYAEYKAYMSVARTPKETEIIHRYDTIVSGFPEVEDDLDTLTEHSYTVSNTQPVKFYNEVFEMKEIGDTVEEWFDSFRHQAEHMEYEQHEPFEIVLFDGYQVHTPEVATEDVDRVTLNVTFSANMFRDIGNGINPTLPYDWKFRPARAMTLPIMEE